MRCQKGYLKYNLKKIFQKKIFWWTYESTRLACVKPSGFTHPLKSEVLIAIFFCHTDLNHVMCMYYCAPTSPRAISPKMATDWTDLSKLTHVWNLSIVTQGSSRIWWTYRYRRQYAHFCMNNWMDSPEIWTECSLGPELDVLQAAFRNSSPFKFHGSKSAEFGH